MRCVMLLGVSQERSMLHPIFSSHLFWYLQTTLYSFIFWSKKIRWSKIASKKPKFARRLFKASILSDKGFTMVHFLVFLSLSGVAFWFLFID